MVLPPPPIFSLPSQCFLNKRCAILDILADGNFLIKNVSLQFFYLFGNKRPMNNLIYFGDSLNRGLNTTFYHIRYPL
jgi:hypothetical protein